MQGQSSLCAYTRNAPNSKCLGQQTVYTYMCEYVPNNVKYGIMYVCVHCTWYDRVQ